MCDHYTMQQRATTENRTQAYTLPKYFTTTIIWRHLERNMGVEPMPAAWKATVLP